MLNQIKKFIPKKLFHALQPAYHYLLAFSGAVFYGFPSKKVRIVAITGTKGKTSAAEIVNAILEEAGYTTSLIGSLRMKIGNTSAPNPYGMSMPGRFALQRFIAKAVKEKSDWVVMEMTSEGAKQFRHKYIYLDALIFTNLAPEHIESHGSFEKYLEHKQRIAESLGSSPKEKKIVVVNADDSHAESFIPKGKLDVVRFSLNEVKPYTSDSKGVSFTWKGVTMRSPLKGEFSIRNILGAAHFAESIGIEPIVIARTLGKLAVIPGRGEHVTLEENHPSRQKQNFDVIVDYAHTKESLEALYSTFANQKKICVLGNTGGGRDIWKRPKMAEVADQYCDEIILTTEDPYDEDPQNIANDMLQGIKSKKPTIILDRREAIQEALTRAKEGDAVLITGMGSQEYMCLAGGKKIPWSDAKIAREELEKILTP
jgi:UDP-N-acetylmuramoyl-L-alanyl-D-glutamate--2,6-diaminopimelate ligase